MRLHKKPRSLSLDGYFTVEATLLFPSVFFIIIFLIHTAMMLYGRCLLSQDAYILSFRGSVRARGTSPEAYVHSHADEQFGKKYFGNEPPVCIVTADASEVRVQVFSDTRRRSAGWYPRGFPNLWDISASARASIIDPVARIRKFARLTALGKSALNGLSATDP